MQPPSPLLLVPVLQYTQLVSCWLVLHDFINTIHLFYVYDHTFVRRLRNRLQPCARLARRAALGLLVYEVLASSFDI